MDSLRKAANITLMQCMKLKKNETLLIITDKNKKKIAQILYEEAFNKCRHVMMVTIPVAGMHGEEPPAIVAEVMKKYDVIIAPTTMSLTHTNAVRIARKNSRIATMPGITEAMLKRGMTADYNDIAKRTSNLKKQLNKGKIIRVTTRMGTDISLEKSRKLGAKLTEGLIHKKGDYNNLPAGEAGLVPKYKSAQGVFIVDKTMGGVGRPDKPIKITVKKGYAVKIEGGKSAAKLRKILKSCGKNAYNIAELGIGTNDKAKLSGSILEDEKVMGTAHIALGNSTGMGGNIYAKCHLDGVFNKPTISVDNNIIIKDGKFIF